MKNELDSIYESKIIHNSFLDKDSVIDAMTESYFLGYNKKPNTINIKKGDKNMTNEKMVEEILHEAESLKFRIPVINLSRKMRESNPLMTVVLSLELALEELKQKNNDGN
jgi:hypothetical protein